MTLLSVLSVIAMAYGWLLLWGVLLPLPLWLGALVGVFMAGGVGYWQWARLDFFALRALVPLMVLMAPLFWLVGQGQPAQWDEFSHWLWAGWELWQSHRFPHDGAMSATSFPAYPQLVGLIFYLPALVMQSFPVQAVALFNTALVGLFGLMVVQAASGKTQVGWGGAALAILLAFAINPVFVPKLTFVAYAEVLLGVGTAALAFALWRWVQGPFQQQYIWYGAAIGVVLVGTKQVGLVLWALVVGAVVLWALVQPGARRELWRLWPLVLLPVATFLLWRWHVAQHLSGAEFTFRPLADWLWQDAGTILNAAWGVMQRKGHLFIPLAGLTIYGVWGWVQQLRGGRLVLNQSLAFIAAAVGWGYVLFLLLTYLGSFTRGEELMVASFWRYSTHFGWLVWAATLVCLWPLVVLRLQRYQRWLALPSVLLVLALPVIFKSELQFHNEEGKNGLRAIAQQALQEIPSGFTCTMQDVPQADFGYKMLRWLWREQVQLVDAREVEVPCRVMLTYNPMQHKHQAEAPLTLGITYPQAGQTQQLLYRWSAAGEVQSITLY